MAFRSSSRQHPSMLRILGGSQYGSGCTGSSGGGRTIGTSCWGAQLIKKSTAAMNIQVFMVNLLKNVFLKLYAMRMSNITADPVMLVMSTYFSLFFMGYVNCFFDGYRRGISSSTNRSRKRWLP